MILVLQLQLRKATGGVSVGDDTHDLRVVALLLSKILDALTGSDRLRDALGVGVDTVRGNFLCPALAVHIVEIGVDLLPDASVDGEVGQLLPTIVDIHFTEGFFLTAGGKSGGREHTQHRDQHQQQCDQSFFHVRSS